MRVLPRKFLFSSRSRCHRRLSHGHSPDLLEQEDAQQASPCQSPVPDATGGSTLNGDAKVEAVEHRRSTEDCNPEERTLGAGNGEDGNIADSEAEETSSSDEAVHDEDETSENGSAGGRALESVDDEGGPAIDGTFESRRVKDIKDEQATAIHGVDENGTPSKGVENEQRATRDRVAVENGALEDATDENRKPAFDITTVEEDGQVRRRDPIRSSFRKPSDSGPQVPKKVRWTDNIAEVHEYENNERREPWDDVPMKCVCIIL